jgi:hypothetical protein
VSLSIFGRHGEVIGEIHPAVSLVCPSGCPEVCRFLDAGNNEGLDKLS